MKDALLIQQVEEAQSDKWGSMIALYYGRHVEYCQKHKADYWCQIGPVRYYDVSPWMKIALAQRAFLQGYKYVAWLDADAYIEDLSADFRQACIGPISMVRWEYPLSHLQAGVIYFNNEGQNAYTITTHLLEERKYYLERFPTLRGWYEQGQINEMARQEQTKDFFHEIPIEWNWGTHYCPPCEKPIVVAWHGVDFDTKMGEMRERLSK